MDDSRRVIFMDTAPRCLLMGAGLPLNMDDVETAGWRVASWGLAEVTRSEYAWIGVGYNNAILSRRDGRSLRNKNSSSSVWLEPTKPALSSLRCLF